MRRKLLSFSLGILFCFGCAGITAAAQYDHETDVDGMIFSWKVADGTLHVKLSAKTTGWVGIGFNPSEQMKDAGFVLGFVKNGKVELRDDFGESVRNHKEDTDLGGTADVTVIGGEEKKGSTTIEFSMPLDSGDKNDSVIDPNGETVVLLAYGGKRDSFISKHQFKTKIKVNLSTGKVE